MSSSSVRADDGFAKPPRLSPSRRTVLTWAALLLAVGSFFFFHRLGSVTLRMWDEARLAVNALEMLQNGDLIVTHYQGKPDMWNMKPPLMIWMMAASMRLFGVSELAARLPSAVAGLGVVLLLFFFCAYALRDVMAGLCAGFVLMTTTGFIGEHVARSADYDALLVFWTTAYALAFFLYMESTTRRRSSVYLALTTAGITLAVLTKGVGGLMCLPGLLLYVLTERRTGELLRRPQVYVAAFVIATIGVGYYVLRELHNPGYIHAVTNIELFRYSTVAEAHSGDALFYVRDLFRNKFVPWVYVLPFSFLVIHFARLELHRKLGRFVALFLGAYFVVITSSETKLPWYDAPLYPLSTLVIGVALSETLTSMNQRFTAEGTFYGHLRSVTFLIACFALPLADTAYRRVHRQSRILYPWSEDSRGPLAYGDYLRLLLQQRPEFERLRVIDGDYNSHLVFYAEAATLEHRPVEIRSSPEDARVDGPVLTCNQRMRDVLQAMPGITMVHSDGSCATFVSAAEKAR